jgi:hypothetical protein
VEFSAGSSAVRACEYCHTVVVRSGVSLHARGKVAELIDTDSPVFVGLLGTFSGTGFKVGGRVQKSRGDAVWDEWCLEFDDGRTGWLAESEGAWHLMFEVEGAQVPHVDQLAPLKDFPVKGTAFVVEEVAQARTHSMEGQLPSLPQKYAYADATGPRGVFATIEQADAGPPELFVGHTVSLVQLGFDLHQLKPTPKRDALKGALCTNCNGPLALKAPDAARRVACPYCGALLDISNGKLEFLELLEKPPYEQSLPLGAKGKLGGVEYVVVAFLIRSCRVDGTRYPWEEYLLWNREHGFRWLMQSNGHWVFLTPLDAGEVLNRGLQCVAHGETFKAFQTVFARTDYVVGECYWEVKVGEEACATEWVAPPKSLNLDATDHEITYTAGEYLEAKVVQQAFTLEKYPQRGIAPSQPNPYLAEVRPAWTFAGIWAALLVVLVIGFTVTAQSGNLLHQDFDVPPGTPSGSPEAQRFSRPFQIAHKVPVAVHLSAALDNSWLGSSVDLVNQESGEVISVYTEASYYHGVDDGEGWSEGSQHDSKQTADLDPGTYVARVTPQFEAVGMVGQHFTIDVNADGGAGFCLPFIVFFLLLLHPLWVQTRSSGFETARWSESVFQSGPEDGEQGPSDDDEGDDE